MSRSPEYAPERFLSVEDAEEKERLRVEATVVAFARHVNEIGRHARVEPDLGEGSTRISLVAFFRLPKYESKPVNNAALRVVSDWSGYDRLSGTGVDNTGLMGMATLPKDYLAAARRGNAHEHVVASTLGFFNPTVRTMIARLGADNPEDMVSNIFPLRNLTDGISRDLEEQAIGDIHDIHERVQRKGYVDFLDYLIDAQAIISERVATLFDNGVQQP